MLTAFFVNARTAGTAGGFINVLLGLLYLIVAFVPNIPIGAIWALNLFAPTGFAIAIGEVSKKFMKYLDIIAVFVVQSLRKL